MGEGRRGRQAVHRWRDPKRWLPSVNSRLFETYVLEGSGEVIAEGRASRREDRVEERREVIESVRPRLAVSARRGPGGRFDESGLGAVMKTAAAIVTNRGGRTCHAAIVARELGVPAVVGVGSATTAVPSGASVTVSCAEGATGRVYQGQVGFHIERSDVGDLARPKTRS